MVAIRSELLTPRDDHRQSVRNDNFKSIAASSTPASIIMCPLVNPTATTVPTAPPLPPFPQSVNSSLAPPAAAMVASTPSAVSASKASTETLKVPGVMPHLGTSRKQSFGALLQKFASDQHFAMDWLEQEQDDDDCGSVVSVDSYRSFGSSHTSNLSRQGSLADVRDATSSSSATKTTAIVGSSMATGLSTSSVSQLDRRMEGLKVDPSRKKLSQAMIWTWLTTAKQNALPEDSEVVVPSALPPSKPAEGGLTAAAAAAAADVPPKVNTEKLRAKLVKTYPKYYRDLNATSPNNW